MNTLAQNIWVANEFVPLNDLAYAPIQSRQLRILSSFPRYSGKVIGDFRPKNQNLLVQAAVSSEKWVDCWKLRNTKL